MSTSKIVRSRQKSTKKSIRRSVASVTPIRGALSDSSPLLGKVADGLSALDRNHRKYIDESLRAEFADSLEIDENLRTGRESENRWDYLLGYSPHRTIVGLEPHSANTGEVGVVIRKRDRAKEALLLHFKHGKQVVQWFWVATGRVDFLPMEKTMLRCDENGIRFVGRTLRARDLDSSL